MSRSGGVGGGQGGRIEWGADGGWFPNKNPTKNRGGLRSGGGWGVGGGDAYAADAWSWR